MEDAAASVELEAAMLDDFMGMADSMSAALDDMTEEERVEVINALVTKITLGESIDIEMALGVHGVDEDMVGSRRDGPSSDILRYVAAVQFLRCPTPGGGNEMRIVDTHTHAGLNWFEPVELLVHQMNLNDVEKAVLIQHGRPQTGAYDHEYLFECVERFPGRFAVVVIVDVTLPDAPERLEKYAARGALGIRLNPTQRSPAPDPLAIWHKAAELGLVVSSMGRVDETASDEFSELVAAFPGLPIILEHMAGGGESAAFPANGPGPQPPYTMFKKAMELARFPNTFIKVHGIGEISPRPSVLPARYDLGFFDAVPPLIEMARDAFGVRRMMWGSDYPPVSQREGYRNALRGVMDNPALDTQEDREWVMGKTALGVFKLE